MENIKRMKDFLKKKAIEEVLEILKALNEDYDLEVLVSYNEICLIIDEFYKYYEKLEIIFEFRKMVTNHFNDMAIMAIEADCKVDVNFVLNSLKLLELCDSVIEVSPDEVEKVLKKIKLIMVGGKE